MMESKPYGYNLKDLSNDTKTIIAAELARLSEKGLIKKRVGRALFKSKP